MSIDQYWPYLTEQIVATSAKDVFINKEGVMAITKEVMRFLTYNHGRGQFCKVTKTFLRWTDQTHPRADDSKAIDWLFVLNTLNFSLYIPKATEQWTVNGYTGYLALSYAIERAIRVNGIPLWDPNYYMNIKKNELESIFQGDNDTIIPFLPLRVKILHKVGTTLVERFGGRFVNCVKFCRYNADALVQLLVLEFASYGDISEYNKQEVTMLTKAWALITDLWWYAGAFSKLNIKSTMFIDYRSTQVLLHYKVLRYSDRLLKIIEKNTPLSQGSQEELEIRCCSIIAMQMICKEVETMCKNLETQMPEILTPHSISMLVDNYVWCYQIRYENDLENMPLYNVNTIHY